MSDKIMSIEDFVELGYLQELNRQFLHPLGLALQVYVDANGRYRFTEGVVDCRDNLEGMYFDYKGSDKKRIDTATTKAKYVRRELEKRTPVRVDKLGFGIEPIEK